MSSVCSLPPPSPWATGRPAAASRWDPGTWDPVTREPGEHPCEPFCAHAFVSLREQRGADPPATAPGVGLTSQESATPFPHGHATLSPALVTPGTPARSYPGCLLVTGLRVFCVYVLEASPIGDTHAASVPPGLGPT